MESSIAQIPTFTLSSGHAMPMIGLGTDGIQDPQIIARAIIELGYRTIDTASRYKNEEAVGKAIKMAAGVSREELFVITKVWIDEVEDVEGACRRSLEKLGLQQVDLYLLHWPIAVREVEWDEAKNPTRFEKIKIPVHKIWP